MGKADRSGERHKPAVLQAQTKRLLDDPRSRALFDGFGAPWLNVGGVQRQVFDRIAAIEARQKEAAMEKARVRLSKRQASDSPPNRIEAQT